MSYLRHGLTRHSWWIAIAWVAVGLITATQVVVGCAALGEHHNWTTLFFTTAGGWLIWVAATPVILWLSRRFPLMAGRNWTNIPVHIAAALAISFVRIAWSAALEWIVNPLDVAPHPHYRSVFLVMVYLQFHTGFIIYAVTVAIDNIVDYVRRLARGEAESARLAGELSKAQFEALSRQLEPHFLFNTLNGIAGLVRDKQNDAAVEMIAGLSALLRRVLEDSGSQFVPLGEEVSFLGSYLGLQSMRLGERLKVSVDIPVELYGAMVPQLLLQPLVENAIVHGIDKLVEGGHIGVRACEAQGVLSIHLYNDGPSPSPGNANERAGVGLLNTRRRLVALYGSGSSVELQAGEQAGVETIVRVPYRTAA